MSEFYNFGNENQCIDPNAGGMSSNPDNQNMSVDPGQSTKPATSSSASKPGNQSSNADYLYSNPNEQNMTMADGSNSAHPNSSSATTYNGVYDYQDQPVSSSTSEPNMSVDNSDTGGGGVCNSSNYYSGLVSTPSAGGMSVDPMASYSSDIPVAPNVVLSADGNDLQPSNWPVLDVLVVAPDGTMSMNACTLFPGEKGRLHWNSQNATTVQINSEDVNINGSMDIPYNDQYTDSTFPYEVVAWRTTPETSVVHEVTVMMSKAATGKSLDFHQVVNIKLPDVPGGKYFKITSGLLIDLGGKFAFNDGNKSVNAGWDAGIGVSLSKGFKSGNWGVEPKLSFKMPIDITGSDPDVTDTWAELSGGAEGTYTFIIDDSAEFVVALEIAINILKISRPRGIPGAEWEFKSGTFDVTLSGSFNGKCKCQEGEFTGTIKVGGKLSVEPEWKMIIANIVERYGITLGIDSVGTVAAGVAAVVTSPVTIAAGVVATLTIGLAEIAGAYSHMALRETVDKLTDQIIRGVNDGLTGVNTQVSSVTVVDEATAYVAGVSAGATKRKELADNNEPFDAKPSEDKRTIINTVKAEVLYRMHQKFFNDEASNIRESVMTYVNNDYETIKKLMSAWNNIIGNSPVRRGGRYLTLWKNNLGEYGKPGMTYYDGNW